MRKQVTVTQILRQDKFIFFFFHSMIYESQLWKIHPDQEEYKTLEYKDKLNWMYTGL